MLMAAVVTETSSSSGIVQSVSNTFNYLISGDWAVPTWDLLILILFIAAVFLYGISLGRDRIIVILVSIYMAFAITWSLPLGSSFLNFSDGDPFIIRVIVFLGLFLLLFLLLSRSTLMNTFGNLANSWFQVFLFSIFHVGLLVSVTLSFLPPDAAGYLAPATRTIFSSDWARFIWMTAPVVSLALLRS